MRKNRALFVLATPDYQPELCEITFPLLKKYADKLKADFVRIEERKFPEYPITYERFQIHELGRGNEWNLCIDPDLLVHPDIDDFTSWLPMDTVGNMSYFDARAYFDVQNNPIFQSDGRFYGIVDCMVATSRLTHDLWDPMTVSCEKLEEVLLEPYDPRRISEFALSYNLAKYELKIGGIIQEPVRVHHISVTSESIKSPLEEAYRVLKAWGLRA
jgi:hypothetical protein